MFICILLKLTWWQSSFSRFWILTCGIVESPEVNHIKSSLHIFFSVFIILFVINSYLPKASWQSFISSLQIWPSLKVHDEDVACSSEYFTISNGKTKQQKNLICKETAYKWWIGQLFPTFKGGQMEIILVKISKDGFPSCLVPCTVWTIAWHQKAERKEGRKQVSHLLIFLSQQSYYSLNSCCRLPHLMTFVISISLQFLQVQRRKWRREGTNVCFLH